MDFTAEFGFDLLMLWFAFIAFVLLSSWGRSKKSEDSCEGAFPDSKWDHIFTTWEGVGLEE